MPSMTGGQALIRSLLQQGIRVVFGLPGAGQYEAVDALYEEPLVRYITTRHEQATSYMADGYARAGGQIAATLVVPGPGLLNATAGIATAYAVSSPMLVITGSSRTGNQAEDGEFACLRSLTSWAARANHPGEIPALVAEAVQRLKRGRPRPVALQIPSSVLAAVADINLAPTSELAPPDSDLVRIREAAGMLARARRPVIWAGGGLMRAQGEVALQRLAETYQAPVVMSQAGKGAMSDRHPLSLGLAELRYQPLEDWLRRRDLILVVGTSWSHGDFPQQIVQIDVDPSQIGESPNVIGLVGDARRVLEQLIEAVAAAEHPDAPAAPDVRVEVQALNSDRFDPAKQLQPQWDLMDAVRSAMPDDAVLVQGMNQMGYYSRNYYPVYAPRAYLTASSLGTLGAAYPIALGAKVAQPERAVVALCGDGGFLYNSQELATAVQYGINVVAIVFNDNAYGNVLRAQLEEYGGRVIGTKLHNPDFAELAKVYGARGVRAETASKLEEALRGALEVDAPTVIEVPVGMLDRVY